MSGSHCTKGQKCSSLLPSSLGHPHLNFLGDPAGSAQREWFPGDCGEHNFPSIVGTGGTRDVYGSTFGDQEDNFYQDRSWTLGSAKTLPVGDLPELLAPGIRMLLWYPTLLP